MNRETKIKIICTGLFIILILGISYLVYYSGKSSENKIIESIKLSGNMLLNENDYLSFTKLSEQSNEVTLPIIKSRFEKHPYILRADVKFINENEVGVFLSEKKIYGLIVDAGEAFFITDDFIVLPVFPNTKMLDVPVISNLKKRNIKPLKKFTNQDIVQAFKIIDASKSLTTQTLKDISEINLRSGGDVLITFSYLNIPVIFGRNNEAGKILSLEALLINNLKNNYLKECNYIDLRFYNEIYLGSPKGMEL